jgi:hypothetical protein
MRAVRIRRAIIVIAALSLLAVSWALLNALDRDARDAGEVLGTSASSPRWAPPALENPETVQVTNERSKLELDPARDYVLEMPDEPLASPGGLVVAGGRNVVLVGGVIRIGWQGREVKSHQRRGLFLTGQTGTVHVEGLHITGPDLGEGINLDQRRGATVQLVNIRVDTVRARDQRRFTDSHPDLLQTWAGPRRLRIDGFRGRTGYQGFFLTPRQFDPRQRPVEVDIRNVSITGTRRSAYLLWTSDDFPMRLRNVHLDSPAARKERSVVWPEPSAWPGVRTTGKPLSHMPARRASGLSYRASSR